MRWWIADAYVLGQLHARTMAELNLLKSIGHWAIAAEQGQWLRQHPDALQKSISLPPQTALRGGSGAACEGANGTLIQIINPLLLQHCGVILDRLLLEQNT